MTINKTSDLLDGKMYNQINEDILNYHKLFFGGNIMETQSYLSSGIDELNSLLKGGYKKGSLTEISGATDTGKTLLALKAIKELQKDEKLTIFIDASCQLQREYFLDNELDEDGMIIIRPNCIEDLAVTLSEIVKPNIEHIGLIIIDSLADLSTKKEQESKLSTNTDVHRSKVIKALLTRIANLVRNTEACAIILNQHRANFEGETTAIVSTSERWIKMTCDTRLKLSLDDEGDICVDVSFKDKIIQ